MNAAEESVDLMLNRYFFVEVTPDMVKKLRA